MVIPLLWLIVALLLCILAPRLMAILIGVAWRLALAIVVIILIYLFAPRPVPIEEPATHATSGAPR